MKRLMSLLVVLLGLCGFASAEQTADDAALQAMLEKHPEYTVLTCDQWGDTAAAALGMGEERILCVAEKVDGAWTLAIDNAKALPKGAEIDFFIDTDISLYWSIPDTRMESTMMWHYSCFREEGVWGLVSCIQIKDCGENGITEVSCRWANDTLRKVVEYYDENENFIRREETAAIPARWLWDCLLLENYDASIVPVPDYGYYLHSWLNEAALRRFAAEIAPEYTFVDGAAKDDGVEMIVQEQDGTLRLVTCACYDGTPITNISSPLPENTHYGYENFWDALSVNDHSAAGVSPYADGSWAVRYTWPMTGDGDILHYGRNWISGDAGPNFSRLFVGDHPWQDISNTDWESLPASLEEALEHLDPSRWAVVNNPDPADRLHLRYRDDKTSRSFGKYYNGTPAEVLRTAGDWAFVRVGGMTGWMMKEYLAFGKDAWQVEAAFPDLSFVEDQSYFLVWREDRMLDGKFPADGDWSVERGESVVIMGLEGDAWYHVWFPDLDESGYMRQSDFWPGNG